jgi:hypothetical protein
MQCSYACAETKRVLAARNLKQVVLQQVSYTDEGGQYDSDFEDSEAERREKALKQREQVPAFMANFDGLDDEVERVLGHRCAQPPFATAALHAPGRALCISAPQESEVTWAKWAVGLWSPVVECRDMEGVEPFPEDPWATREFHVKWKRWSYIHCSWDTRETLAQLGGYKRIHNYMKRVDEQQVCILVMCLLLSPLYIDLSNLF